MKDYDNNNVFAKIIDNEIPCTKIYEDDKILAIKDVAPIAPIHILVIPKEKFVSFHDFTANADDTYIIHFFKIVRKIAEDLDLGIKGYRLIANHGKAANQMVDHFHMHIIAGADLGSLLITK